MKLRPVKDILFAIACALCVGVSLSCLFLIVLATLHKGFQRLNLGFLFSESYGMGLEGGIFYQIVGTIILILTAALVASPIACALALLEKIFMRPKWGRSAIRVALNVLNGTPSIIFGILGFLLFVKGLGWEKSWLSGGIILGLMILPTVTVALMERLETIPINYLEQAKALGFDDNLLGKAILIPYGWGGLLTGLVLGLARAAGETAPIMMTATVFSGATWPTGIKDNPVLSLPYHIFNLAQDAYDPRASQTAWATATVLTGVVILMSVVVIPLRRRSHEEARV